MKINKLPNDEEIAYATALCELAKARYAGGALHKRFGEDSHAGVYGRLADSALEMAEKILLIERGERDCENPLIVIDCYNFANIDTEVGQ